MSHVNNLAVSINIAWAYIKDLTRPPSLQKRIIKRMVADLVNGKDLVI